MIVVVMDMQEGEDLMNKFYNGMDVVYRCNESVSELWGYCKPIILSKQMLEN